MNKKRRIYQKWLSLPLKVRRWVVPVTIELVYEISGKSPLKLRRLKGFCLVLPLPTMCQPGIMGLATIGTDTSKCYILSFLYVYWPPPTREYSKACTVSKDDLRTTPTVTDHYRLSRQDGLALPALANFLERFFIICFRLSDIIHCSRFLLGTMLRRISR